MVVVDISIDPGGGLAAIETMTKRFPSVPFMALSDQLEGERILAAMKAGARYFLTKGCLEADLLDAMSRLAPRRRRPPPAAPP